MRQCQKNLVIVAITDRECAHSGRVGLVAFGLVVEIPGIQAGIYAQAFDESVSTQEWSGIDCASRVERTTVKEETTHHRQLATVLGGLL